MLTPRLRVGEGAPPDPRNSLHRRKVEMMEDAHICRICGNRDSNPIYPVREMMYGTGKPFTYFQCGACGCLQIDRVPDDLGRYYPDNYMSFKDYSSRARKPLRRYVEGARVRYWMEGRGFLGRLIAVFKPVPDYAHWARVAGIGRDARVLDLGCGNGKLLLRMMNGGFTALEGADPFIASDTVYPGGVTIRKASLNDISVDRLGAFDLVMMHHAFEHMDEPADVLREAARLLAVGGTLLIRIPVADSYVWEHYRENWVQLDPPRHLYLHTQDSMARLAESAGLDIFAVEHDSTAVQFMESERYARGLPMVGGPKLKELFTKAEQAEYEKRAAALNREGRGDQAAFYLRRRLAVSPA
jgi:SAM-dependent methyltransferase